MAEAEVWTARRSADGYAVSAPSGSGLIVAIHRAPPPGADAQPAPRPRRRRPRLKAPLLRCQVPDRHGTICGALAWDRDGGLARHLADLHPHLGNLTPEAVKACFDRPRRGK